MIEMNTKPPLDHYYQLVQDIILDRQDPITGLLPASTAVTAHGDYTDAWVRDNVYSILAAWGLALAYRRSEENKGRTYELEQSVVKLMRGLLVSMMRQAHKVERFKHTQDPLDALHAKYDTHTGDVVVGDHEWGHLQLDATSLYLLMLAQMTASGLRIIFTIDEVNFIQNLIHYIGRAYRTPDYGIWERGNKSNHGVAELNASSVGMAKAALEAMSGFNLFGAEGGQASIVHVLSDEIARSRIALESLLPRESISKEVDSAVLSIIGYPAFAVEDLDLLEKTEQHICEKLEGKYGCKRFLLDGHQVVIEDPHRMYYESHELKQFMDIECEWPLFFSYLLLNNLFAGHTEKAREYREKLKGLLVEHNGQLLLPELYIVPEDKIAAERANPHSQERVPNENVPLVWAQSLFILGEMIQDGLLKTHDIDPLGRGHCIHYSRDPDLKVQLTLLAEDAAVQSKLNELGINTQTFDQIAPIQVREASHLAAALTQVGLNKGLGLSGRPSKQIRALGTSLLYKLGENQIVFLPQFMNQRGFYLALDIRLLVERLRLELSYIFRHWDRPGKPLVAIVIRHNMLDNEGHQLLLEFMTELQQGEIRGTPVQLGNLNEFISTTTHETINYLHDFRFSETRVQEPTNPCSSLLLPINKAATAPINPRVLNDWNKLEDEALIQILSTDSNLFAQFEILNILKQRHELDFDLNKTEHNSHQCRLRDWFEEVYTRAGNQNIWSLVRRSAGILGKYDADLEQAITDMLVRQKRISVGREYSNGATIQRPASATEILDRIRTYNSPNVYVHIITQELIIYLGVLIKSDPDLFSDMHTVRVGHIMQLIIIRLQRQLDCTLGEAFDALLALAPHEIARQVKETLADYQNSESQLSLSELLRYDDRCNQLSCARFTTQLNPKDRGRALDWHEWREQRGSIGRQSEAFFAAVWQVLHHCKGLIISEKLSSDRRLDSEEILAQMTAQEQSFVLLINHRLDKIQSPDFRQLTMETLQALAVIFQENPELQVDDTILTDTLINHAVRLSWLEKHPERAAYYEEDQALSWQGFYQLPPNEVANGIIDALNYLLNVNNETQGVQA
ncbi:MAG: glycoside hydrolase family 15 protein [Methyloprofundus sp.]|nr:glycoside hydrolase family 15 protein [Methyloprofundus sp.]